MATGHAASHQQAGHMAAPTSLTATAKIVLGEQRRDRAAGLQRQASEKP